jgi:RNA polymerase sigma-70 factor, ECF subfamily
MLAWVAGDAGAFERLYHRHKGPLFRYFRRHIVPPAVADEAFQDVWQKVIQARERYRPDAPFAAWLFTLAHHRLMDHYRSLRPGEPLPDTLEAPASQQPETDAGRRQEAARLLAALAGLPAEQREIIVLREEENLTLEQIAAIQGVGRETVKSRLRYALAKLREVLGDGA